MAVFALVLSCAAQALGAERPLTRAERKAVDVARIGGASTESAAHVRIRFAGDIQERLGRGALKDARVTIELRPASGRPTVITEGGSSSRSEERRRGTRGEFDVVRDGRTILVLVEDLRAPARRVVVSTSSPGASASGEVMPPDEFDRLLDGLPTLEEEGDLKEERAEVRDEVNADEDALDNAEREADRTIGRINRAEQELRQAQTGAAAREARRELERQKKKLEELTELRRTLRARVKLLRRWLAVLSQAVRGLTVRQCNDGGDNGDSEDTLADHPADPGCVEPADNDEKDVQLPLACPQPGGTVSPYAILNTPLSNTFDSLVLRMLSSGEEVLLAPISGPSGGPSPLPGNICGVGVNVTFQYVIYSDGTPYSLPDPPAGDHAIRVLIEAENPPGSGNPGGQDASLRLATGTAR